MGTNVKINQVLEIIPEYLTTNDYFINKLLQATAPSDRLTMYKKRYNYYFLKPFDLSEGINFFPFLLNFTKKGTTELEMENTTGFNDDKTDISKPSTTHETILAVPKKDGSFSIFTRSIVVKKSISNGSTEKSQRLEKRNYDSNGVLQKLTIESYEPEESQYDNTSLLSWNKSLPLKKQTTYYYLSEDDAIIREKCYNSTENAYFYTTFKNGDEENRQRIDECTFSQHLDKYYNEIHTVIAGKRAKAKVLPQ